MKEYILTIRWEETVKESIPWGVITAIIVYLICVTVMIIDAKRKSIGTLIWDPQEEEYEKRKIFSFGDDTDKGQTILLKSEHNLYNVTLYKLDDEERKKKKSKDVLKNILTPEECVIVHILPVEYIPRQMIEFENEAFMKCSIKIQSNGRIGDIALTKSYTMTFKSMIYFMLLGLVSYKG